MQMSIGPKILQSSASRYCLLAFKRSAPHIGIPLLRSIGDDVGLLLVQRSQTVHRNTLVKERGDWEVDQFVGEESILRSTRLGSHSHDNVKVGRAGDLEARGDRGCLIAEAVLVWKRSVI
jgi:hypothetical protein